MSFRVESIRAERYSFEAVQQLSISINTMFGKPERRGDSVAISFLVKLDCSPPIASIDVKGVVMVTPASPEEARGLESELGRGVVPSVVLFAVHSYTIPIISLLSRELGLPPPIPLPVAPGGAKQEKRVDYHL